MAAELKTDTKQIPMSVKFEVINTNISEVTGIKLKEIMVPCHAFSVNIIGVYMHSTEIHLGVKFGVDAQM